MRSKQGSPAHLAARGRSLQQPLNRKGDISRAAEESAKVRKGRRF
jgi:hypothetical protein